MSFDIFLQAFKAGDGATGDGAAARAVLRPLLPHGEAGGFIETSDGTADVYGLDDADPGLMFNHVRGRQAWDVIYAAAHAGGFAIMPAGCVTLLPDEAMRNELPEFVPEPVLVIHSGAELLAVIESS
jgi:hypothetical protein